MENRAGFGVSPVFTRLPPTPQGRPIHAYHFRFTWEQHRLDDLSLSVDEVGLLVNGEKQEGPVT
jgi:hypothetical protein